MITIIIIIIITIIVTIIIITVVMITIIIIVIIIIIIIIIICAWFIVIIVLCLCTCICYVLGRWGFDYNFTNYNFINKILNKNTPLARYYWTKQGFFWNYSWWNCSRIPIRVLGRALELEAGGEVQAPVGRKCTKID